MTQEPRKNNTGLIVAAFIGIVGTIVASIIVARANYNIEKERQAFELTRIALVAIATEGGATQVALESTANAPTQLPYPTLTPRAVIATITASPTTRVVVPTQLPLGGAIIGALNSDGSVAGEHTSSIELFPKTLVDAVGELHGDRNKGIFAFPDLQTGLAEFSDLPPGIYVVCFNAPGGSIKVGEVNIEANTILKMNFKWRTFTIGSECQL